MAKTIVLGAKDSRKCDVNLYLKQTMTSENSVMSYQQEMKAEDVKAGKVFYAIRTHAIAGTNYDIASGMINLAVEDNVSKFSKASFPPQ